METDNLESEIGRLGEKFFGKDRACLVCGDASLRARTAMVEYAYSFMEAGRTPLRVCGRCAKEIANAFSYKHGGEAAFDFNNEWPTHKMTAKRTKPRKGTSPRRALTVFRRDGFKCRKCSSSEDLTVDHIIPLLRGGSEEDDNLQTLCRTCNSEKGAKLDWSPKNDGGCHVQ